MTNRMVAFAMSVSLGAAGAASGNTGAPEQAWTQAAALEQAGIPSTQELASRLERGDVRVPEVGAIKPVLPRPKPDFDAFRAVPECSFVDARFFGFRAITLREALEALKPCTAGLSRHYAVTVFATEWPRAELHPALLPPAKRGIRLWIQGPTVAAAMAAVDIRYSLSLRYHALLGHPAEAFYLGRSEPRPGRSSLQEVLNRCVLPMLVAPVRTAQDFVDTYGTCLRDPSLEQQIVSVSANPSQPSVVSVSSLASSELIERMNGMVQVPGEGGPFWVRIAAFSSGWCGTPDPR